eukprot:1973077-Prymnesium_polylepis.1
MALPPQQVAKSVAGVRGVSRLTDRGRTKWQCRVKLEGNVFFGATVEEGAEKTIVSMTGELRDVSI